MNQNIQNHQNLVNTSKENTTIVRGKHDKENPYVLISKKIFRDKSISIKAKGLMGYLLSLPSDWIARPKQIATELGIGKDQIYSLLKELIKAGYATKTQQSYEGRFSTVQYEFFEEKLEFPQKIKEKITVSENPDTEIPDTENPTLLSNVSNKLHKTYEYKEKVASLPKSAQSAPNPENQKTADAMLAEARGDEFLNSSKDFSKEEAIKKKEFSPQVHAVASEMIQALKAEKSNYAEPKNLKPILISVDFLLRIDGRSPESIKDVFSWALHDEFWRPFMFKPNPAKYLREKFDVLEMKMKNPAKKTTQVDRRNKDINGNPIIDEQYRNLF